MQSISLTRLVSFGFLGPGLIILGAIGSVILGHGQAVMLPSTVAALIFYGALIAVGVACHDGVPRFFESKPAFFVVLGAASVALATTIWIAAGQGATGLWWRPALTAGICLWLGVILASVVPKRAFR